MVQTIVYHLVFKGLDAADAYTVNHAYTLFVEGVEVYLAVFDSLFCSDDGELCVAVHLASFLAVDIVVYVEAFNLASKLCFEVGGVKMGDRGSTALTCQQVCPGFFSSIAYGCNGANARYYYSF